MNREGIRAAVSDYLDRIEKGTGSESGNEERLVPVLDGLALAMNSVDSKFDEREWPLAPRRDTRRLRALVCRRFPNYGFYNVPNVVTERIAESEVIVADAIDDIEEIAGELLDFEWYLANTSEEDAYWHLAFNYRGHWREHLRGLQFYLVALDFEAIHLPEPTGEDSSPCLVRVFGGPARPDPVVHRYSDRRSGGGCNSGGLHALPLVGVESPPRNPTAWKWTWKCPDLVDPARVELVGDDPHVAAPWPWLPEDAPGRRSCRPLLFLVVALEQAPSRPGPRGPDARLGLHALVHRGPRYAWLECVDMLEEAREL